MGTRWRSSSIISKPKSGIRLRACSPSSSPPERVLGLMWSDKPVHREFTAGPSHLPAEANHHRIHNPVAVAPVPNTAPRNNGKSRPERACDLCRRRKTKCDGPSAPDNACSNCVQNNQSCTYLCAYMHAQLSFHVSHLPSAKSLAQEVHQKRSSPDYRSSISDLRTLTQVMSLALRTAWRGWKHCSRECVSNESVNTAPF